MGADRTVRQLREAIRVRLAASFSARGLLASVRLLFLAFGLLNILIAVPMLFFYRHGSPLLHAGSGMSLAWLAWWWIRGYRRGRFSALGILFEGVALLTVGAGLTNPRALLGVLYSGVFLHATYGKRWILAAAPIVYLSAYTGAVSMAEALNGAIVGEGLQHFSGVALTTGMMYLIMVTLSRYEQILARERTLSKAGSALVAAQDRQSIHKAVVEAAVALVGGDQGGRAGLLMGSPEVLTVVAAAGRGANRFVGTKFTLGSLPQPLLRGFQEDRLIELTAAQLENLRPALPFSSQYALVIPMRVKGELQAAISLESAARLHDDVKEALQALSSGLTLALGSFALNEQLAQRATHDPLTGLANRAVLRDRLEHALARAHRHARPLALLFIDLDNFKVVNDSFGHTVGDQLLVAVADRLKRCVRGNDTVARLGGDEFALLLEDLGDPRDAARVAERVLRALQIPVVLDREITARASIGIAVSAAGGEDASALLCNADLAMYEAKRLGKSQFHIYEPELHAATVAHLQLEADLRRAVEQQAFILHYQPIVDLATRRIAGVEALVRWQHPTRGLVLPREFIPLAEEVGLISSIDRWALQQACAQGRRWHEQFPSVPPLNVAVNLSTRSLQSAELAHDIQETLRVAQFPPASLIVEMTESMLMHDTDAAVAGLGALNALGVQLAIDDFGTGYSSLGYLRMFPIDIIKIAKPFIDGLAMDPVDPTLVQAIVLMASTLRLTPIAEGIESLVQVSRLRMLGCQLGQGYHFAKPAEASVVTELLLRQQAHVDPEVPISLSAVPSY